MSSSLKGSRAAPTPWFIAIGASGSTGMLDIKALLMALRPSIDAIVLIVLHRSFTYPSELHKILARETGMRVILAKDGEHFERGSCYIGKPAAHLSLAARSFGKLVDDPRASHRNRTIDLLFRSVAAHGGGRVIVLALDAIGVEEGIAIMQSVVAAAKKGDMRAADILLRRLWPERKGRPVQMDLPAIMSPSDIVAALGAVAAAVAAGELSPEEGAAVAGILDAQRQAVWTVGMDARVAALESKETPQ